jgi:hypothetical protein
MVLSGKATTYDTIHRARQSANLQNIVKLNPSSNPIITGVLSEAIARECTLTYHTEIQQGSLTSDKSKINLLKEGFRAFFSSKGGGDSKVARGLVGPELTDIQCVAVNQASIAIAYITSLTEFQVNLLAIEAVRDRRAFAAGLVAKILEKYPVSGPRAQVVPTIPVADPSIQAGCIPGVSGGSVNSRGLMESGSNSEKIAGLEAALKQTQSKADDAALKAD